MEIRIVSASKKSQEISEVAASAFVISREDIRGYGDRTLADSLRRITGLYQSSDRNYSYRGYVVSVSRVTTIRESSSS
ncbi:MAG: Plug domain-containing protein [Proteobacteria bacterium]|nr:Plug domain-containing protein [Pseudomonadota bacterium]MBU1058269.1 Plug domain-containing protein [Pseudomonadota bacterium]